MALPNSTVLAERKVCSRSQLPILFSANDACRSSMSALRLSRTSSRTTSPVTGQAKTTSGIWSTSRRYALLLPCSCFYCGYFLLHLKRLTIAELQRPVPRAPHTLRLVLLAVWRRHLGRKCLSSYYALRAPHPRHRGRLHLPEHIDHPGRSARPPPRPDPAMRRPQGPGVDEAVRQADRRRRGLGRAF